MLRSWFRRLGAIGFVLFLLACSGGGCSSGCAGCGVTPLPGGFPSTSAITNAGSVRVTRAGLDFAQTNLGAIAGKALGGSTGVITYPIGNSSTNLGLGTSADVCKNPNSNQCQAMINIAGAKLNLTAVHPDSLTVSGTVPVKVADIPVDLTVLYVGNCTIHAQLGSGFDCNANPIADNFVDVPVSVVLPLVAETTPPRDGYTKVDATKATVTANIDSSMLNFCGGFCASVADALKSYLVGQLTGPLQKQLQSALQGALCTKTNTALNPSCPTGSHDNGGTCYFDALPNTCLPTLLGMDGHVDLSGFLASLSPGTAGGLDFVLASGGDAIASSAITNGVLTNTPDSANGLTLALLGGGLPNPQSGCVPLYDNKIPTGIPIPDEMQDNTIAPWPQGDNGPDLGIALSGRYLNYMLGSVYNSGALCLGISTDQFSQLQSGLLSVLIPSIKRLTFEQKPGPVAITTRPQQPPVIKLGGGTDLNTDPLMSITLKQFAIDFYIWSMDRFVRVMTFTGDITVPVNLSTHVDPKTNPNGGLLPAIGNVTVANPQVTNSQLLTDNPATVASGLGNLFGAIAGQLTGSLKPFSLSSALASYGMGMTIPDGGIRKLTKNSDDYLAIFADLTLAQQNALQQADVQAKILDKKVFADAMTLETADRSKEPMLHVLFGSSLDNGTHVVEYSYAIDQGAKSEWSTTRDLTIQNDALFLQGKHTLNVWARIKGQAMSESAAPAQVPFTIDVLAPTVDLAKNDDGSLKVNAWDLVSADAALQMRWQTTDGLGKKSAWTSWSPVADIPASAFGDSTVTVQVQDEEGNVGSQSSDLIRGKPDPSMVTGSGCGSCTIGASSSTGTGWAYAIPAIAGLVALVLRRRRVEVAPSPRPFVPAGSKTRRTAFVALGALVAAAAAMPNCNCGSNGTQGCGADCQQVCDDALAQGLIGAYTSVAVAKDGTIWVSGYNDSDGASTLYGDLVVGKWDPAKAAVQWQSVDGVPKVPDGQCPSADSSGWRGGVEDPGDDVGLWTSMALDSSDHPMVAYYDATNKQLKFASYDGSNWHTHVVSQKAGADQGRYVKMIMVNGNPVVAFLGMEAGNNGYTRSRVIVGRAKTNVPSSGGDWTFEDAAVNEQDPCQPSFCTAGQACLTTTGGVTGVCTPTVNGCNPACATGQACISKNSAATCVAVYDSSNFFPSYPAVLGDYVSLANGPNGLGIVVYDRFHGNLIAVSDTGGKWNATTLDGQTGSGQTTADTGDDGIAANLVITQNGDWNVTYVNGIQEHLQLVVWPGGKGTPLTPEVVDDGYDNGKPYPDGQHIVGDDAQMQIDGSGNVTIAYQDSTAGALRVATGAPATGGTHKWAAKTVAQQGKFAGFFPKFVTGTTQIANWFRTADATQGTESGDVTLVTP